MCARRGVPCGLLWGEDVLQNRKRHDLGHGSFLSLLALGLKHFEGTKFPKLLMSKYLLTGKTAHQLTVRIKNLNMNRAPDNIVKVSAPAAVRSALRLSLAAEGPGSSRQSGLSPPLAFPGTLTLVLLWTTFLCYGYFS